MWARVSAAIPTPVSVTAITAYRPGTGSSANFPAFTSSKKPTVVVTVSTPPSGIASPAFTARFMRICSICIRSARTPLTSVESSNRTSIFSAAAEGEDLLREVRSALPGPQDLLRHGMTLIPPVQRLPQHLRVAEDGDQEVVEIVGDSARKPADGLHFLGLPVLLLQLHLRSYVSRKRQHYVLTGDEQDPGGHDADPDLPALAPESRTKVLHPAGGGELADHSVSVLGISPDAEVQRRPADDLLPGVPHEARESFIDVDVHAVAETVEVDGQGVGIEGQAELLLALAQRGLHFLLLGDVRRDPPDSHNVPGSVDNRELGRSIFVMPARCSSATRREKTSPIDLPRIDSRGSPAKNAIRAFSL
jgi:hypothetical protein